MSYTAPKTVNFSTQLQHGETYETFLEMVTAFVGKNRSKISNGSIIKGDVLISAATIPWSVLPKSIAWQTRREKYPNEPAVVNFVVMADGTLVPFENVMPLVVCDEIKTASNGQVSAIDFYSKLNNNGIAIHGFEISRDDPILRPVFGTLLPPSSVDYGVHTVFSVRKKYELLVGDKMTFNYNGPKHSFPLNGLKAESVLKYIATLKGNLAVGSTQVVAKTTPDEQEWYYDRYKIGSEIEKLRKKFPAIELSRKFTVSTVFSFDVSGEQKNVASFLKTLASYGYSVEGSANVAKNAHRNAAHRKNSNSFANEIIVFTGARPSEAQLAILDKQGARVASAFSGKTTLVIYKDSAKKDSAAITKAKATGVPIMPFSEFENKLE